MSDDISSDFRALFEPFNRHIKAIQHALRLRRPLNPNILLIPTGERSGSAWMIERDTGRIVGILHNPGTTAAYVEHVIRNKDSNGWRPAE